VRFASPEARAGFSEELAVEIARLTTKYQDETTPGGRRFRFFLGAYPTPEDRKGKRSQGPSDTH